MSLLLYFICWLGCLISTTANVAGVGVVHGCSRPSAARRRGALQLDVDVCAVEIREGGGRCRHNLDGEGKYGQVDLDSLDVWRGEPSARRERVPEVSPPLRNAALSILRGGAQKKSSSIAKSADDSEYNLDHLTSHHSLKRGTRTTGAGASKRRNPSIFSVSSSGSSSGGDSSWTAALAGPSAGDLLKASNDGSRNKNTEDDKIYENPMIGRLWAGISDGGRLVLKIPKGSKKSKPAFVELSEVSSSRNATQSSAAKSSSTISVRYINAKKTQSMSFLPIEGVYGVYHLPYSGPHAVLITDSEGVYSSPYSSLSSTTSNSEEFGSRPLLELRRVKSLEIVPLRGLKNPNNNQQSITEEQFAEEARQLRLLRKSFREHDFYFTVPPPLAVNKSSKKMVVKDVTHSLQRSFVAWTSSDSDESESEDWSQFTSWWTPYFDEKTSKLHEPGNGSPDRRFFWNEQPALALLPHSSNSLQTDGPHALLLDHVIPVTSAFVGVQRNVPIPSSTNTNSSSTDEMYDQILISRRSKYRTGTRFTRRGADDTGAVANYAETEQICFVFGVVGDRELLEVYSHTQTRGSIPLHWSSPAKVQEYRPRVYIGVDPVEQARGVRDHLLGELSCYSVSSASEYLGMVAKAKKRDKFGTKIAMVNLIDKHGDQGRLGNAFDSVLDAVIDVYSDGKTRKNRGKEEAALATIGPHSIKHIWFDFHAECKGGRYDRLVHLLEEVIPLLNSQSYFCAVPSHNDGKSGDGWAIQRLQDGVVRTNCMDCLDRTNVVQSMFGRYMLHRQLHERPGLSVSRKGKRKRTLPLEYVVGYKKQPLTIPWSAGETSHRLLWADNADAISRLYAGTPALKGDFTRTGTRTRRGALDDGLNSLQRYYLNNFIDADRQEGMDLLVGNSDFHDVPFDTDGDHDESYRLYMLQELASSRRRRRGYQESHVRIKVESDEALTFDGNGDDNMLNLKWLPGDLRRHMREEALLSRSPLSSAASEENIDKEDDIVTSSDFLMKVTSAAAGEHGQVRPWWLPHSSSEDPQPQLPRKNNSNSIAAVGKRAMMFLIKAPVLSATVAVAAIAKGLSSSNSSK